MPNRSSWSFSPIFISKTGSLYEDISENHWHTPYGHCNQRNNSNSISLDPALRGNKNNRRHRLQNQLKTTQ